MKLSSSSNNMLVSIFDLIPFKNACKLPYIASYIQHYVRVSEEIEKRLLYFNILKVGNKFVEKL